MPIELLGNFDRNTGEGSVDVPELETEFHPVIATCVGVLAELTTDDIARAIDAGVAFIEANFEPPFPTNVFGEEFAELAGQIAPVMLQELIEPLALGFLSSASMTTTASAAKKSRRPSMTDPGPPRPSSSNQPSPADRPTDRFWLLG